MPAPWNATRRAAAGRLALECRLVYRSWSASAAECLPVYHGKPDSAEKSRPVYRAPETRAEKSWPVYRMRVMRAEKSWRVYHGAPIDIEGGLAAWYRPRYFSA